MDRLGTYHIKPFSQFRRNISLVIREGWRKHNVHEIIEIDVTNGKNLISKFKKKTGKHLSFTGWIVKCAAQALYYHKPLFHHSDHRIRSVSHGSM